MKIYGFALQIHDMFLKRYFKFYKTASEETNGCQEKSGRMVLLKLLYILNLKFY